MTVPPCVNRAQQTPLPQSFLSSQLTVTSPPAHEPDSHDHRPFEAQQQAWPLPHPSLGQQTLEASEGVQLEPPLAVLLAFADVLADCDEPPVAPVVAGLPPVPGAPPFDAPPACEPPAFDEVGVKPPACVSVAVSPVPPPAPPKPLLPLGDDRAQLTPNATGRMTTRPSQGIARIEEESHPSKRSTSGRKNRLSRASAAGALPLKFAVSCVPA
jgi:hypothetical protein